MSKTKTTRTKAATRDQRIKNEKDQTLEHAEALYKHVKGKANDLYKDGKHSVAEAQVNLKHQTDNLAEHVKEKPLSSLLIAGGIGFILSAIFRK
ncbi:MAG: hypothetical protein H0U73_10255 [Tatlockia sp.]|nr:hypothetical protein [Tatlockia sp.]